MKTKILSVDHEKDYKLRSAILKGQSVTIYVLYCVETYPIKYINTFCLIFPQEPVSAVTPPPTKENNHNPCLSIFSA